MNETRHEEASLAIVGLGKMGIMHAAMASQCPGARVGALVDPDRKLGAHVRSIGVEAPIYGSLREAAASESLQGAVIAAPSFAHRSVVEEALEAGLHVLCEKPLAHTMDDARAMAEAARGRPGQRAGVAFMKGHMPLFLSSAELLSQGVLGEIRRFRASVCLSQVFSPKKGWTFTKERSGGGVLINTGIHLVHLCRLLFGRISAVYGKARPMHSAVEDTLTAILEFDNGAFGSLDMSWSVPGYEVEYTHIVVEGSNGVMELDDFNRRLHLLEAWGDLPKGLSVAHQSQEDSARFTLTPDYCGAGYYAEMADFVEAIRLGRAPRYTFEDGLEIQRVVDALYRSAGGEGRTEVSAERRMQNDESRGLRTGA
jgi:predicted dehydrogenase